MFTVNRIGIVFCVLRMLDIFSRGVVAAGKRETAIYLKRWYIEEAGVVPN